MNNPITTPVTPNVTPANIHEQHNTNCQQFFGHVTGCVFAMPGANVYQQPTATAGKSSSSLSSSSKKTSSLPKVTASTVKKAKQTK